MDQCLLSSIIFSAEATVILAQRQMKYLDQNKKYTVASPVTTWSPMKCMKVVPRYFRDLQSSTCCSIKYYASHSLVCWLNLWSRQTKDLIVKLPSITQGGTQGLHEKPKLWFQIE